MLVTCYSQDQSKVDPVSVIVWIAGKIPSSLLAIWRYFSRKLSLNRVVVSPIPNLSRIPDPSEVEYERFVLGFRFFNENIESVVIRGIQPRIQTSPKAIWVDPATTLTSANGQKIEFPVVVQPLSKIDLACEFRLQDNTPRHLRMNVMVFASTPKRDAPIKIEFFRDPDDKQVFVDWQGKESWFGEQRLKPGEKEVQVKFRRELSAVPKMIDPKIMKEEQK